MQHCQHASRPVFEPIGKRTSDCFAVDARINLDGLRVNITHLNTLAANNRLQADLLRLTKTKADDDGRADISLIPLHVGIASRFSTIRETVARVLEDLACKGLIVSEKNAFIINYLGSLQEMVEEVRGD